MGEIKTWHTGNGAVKVEVLGKSKVSHRKVRVRIIEGPLKDQELDAPKIELK